MFCPKCGAILIPKKGRTKTKIACSSCNFVETKRSSLVLKEKVQVADRSPVEVIDKNEKGEIFKAFQLYKPEIEIKVRFN